MRLALVVLVAVVVSGCTGVNIRWWNDHDKPAHWTDTAGTATEANTHQRGR